MVTYAFLTSIVALCIAALAFVRSGRRYTFNKLRKQVAEQQLELTDLRDLYDQLAATHKKITQRQRMRDRRAKPPEETPEEWKQRMRKEIAMSKAGVK